MKMQINTENKLKKGNRVGVTIGISHHLSTSDHNSNAHASPNASNPSHYDDVDFQIGPDTTPAPAPAPAPTPSVERKVDLEHSPQHSLPPSKLDYVQTDEEKPSPPVPSLPPLPSSSSAPSTPSTMATPFGRYPSSPRSRPHNLPALKFGHLPSPQAEMALSDRSHLHKPAMTHLDADWSNKLSLTAAAQISPRRTRAKPVAASDIYKMDFAREDGPTLQGPSLQGQGHALQGPSLQPSLQGQGPALQPSLQGQGHALQGASLQPSLQGASLQGPLQASFQTFHVTVEVKKRPKLSDSIEGFAREAKGRENAGIAMQEVPEVQGKEKEVHGNGNVVEGTHEREIPPQEKRDSDREVAIEKAIEIENEKFVLEKSKSERKEKDKGKEKDKKEKEKDKDKDKKMKSEEGKAEIQYSHYIKRANHEDFSDLQKTRSIFVSGKDYMGRPIVVVVGSLIPAKSIDPERLFLFFIKILDPVVSQDYVVIYVHTNSTAENVPKISWLRKCYFIFSRKYKKNLKELFIIQPTGLMKTVAKFFKPFISHKFWKKLHYVENIKELYQYMDPQQIQLPIILNITKHTNEGEFLEQPLMKEEVPLLVYNAIQYLTLRGLKTEGIFRISGQLDRIEEIKAAYDRGEAIDLSGERDVHLVSGLLKLYIRELPEPLLRYNLYNKWINSYVPSDITNTKQRLKSLLSLLPRTNYKIFEALIKLCVKISEYSDINMMTPGNLAICWAPNILKSAQENLFSALSEAGTVNSIVSCFITHSSYFFDENNELQPTDK